MSTCRRGSRAAFTLVEMIVVMAVLALLVALFLPAIQQSREAARSVTCQNHIRQLILATHAFEASFRHYPRAFCGNAYGKQWCLSPAGQLLDFLDESAIADMLSSLPHSIPDPNWDRRLRVDAPATFHCPSDGQAVGGASSYRFCRGLMPLWPEDPGGVFWRYSPTRSADVLDGLTNTAFISERLIAGPLGTDIRRDPFVLPPMFPESVTPACVAMNRASPGSSRASIGAPLGTRWLSGLLSQSVYYHFLPPNCAWRDCDTEDGAGLALVSARSAHFGGVHVAFGDGACRRISSLVDLATWRAFATRSGGEVISHFE